MKISAYHTETEVEKHTSIVHYNITIQRHR